MKLWPLALLLATPILVQAQTTTRIAPSCGLSNIKFSVNTDQPKAPPAAPDSGKALVYFIEESGAFEHGPAPTVRVGMDGSWIGAAHGNSWFAFNVDPGEHHLCANWQGAVFFVGSNRKVAALHFTAKPGKIYFFRMQNIYYYKAGVWINFTPVDSDEGQILISTLPLAAYRQKK